jgi:hypothetical protein
MELAFDGLNGAVGGTDMKKHTINGVLFKKNLQMR